MKKYLLAFVIFISSLSVNGQIAVQEERPAIEVTGSAEMEVVPDEIFISIVLREKNKNNDKWKIEVQEDNLLKKLKENGFDTKNLSLSGADGNLQYGVFRKNRVLTEKSLLMMVKDAGEVNKLFKILDDLEIEEANISKVSHSQVEKFRKEIKIEALKAAKNKADYLLTAIGEQAGKPLLIREQDFGTYPVALYENTALSNSSFKGLENEVAFTKIKIRYEIFAKFGIK